jgi:hypothetical protein
MEPIERVFLTPGLRVEGFLLDEEPHFTLEPRFHKVTGDSTYIQAALEETVMVSDDGVEILTTTPFLDECLAAAV